MRDLVFVAVMLGLLPLAVYRPFVGVLLWCWISFMNPHRLVYGFAMELPWAVAVFAATFTGAILSGELRRPRVDALTFLLLALLVCITVTSVTALGVPADVWAKHDAVMKVILGLLLTSALLTERRRVHALVWAMVIAIGYYGVRGGIFAIATGGNYRVWGPPQTMITDNNHLAAAMLVTLPLMNYLRLQSQHRVVRNGLAVAMALTLLAAVGSYSRGALLGLCAVAALMWWRSHAKVLSAAVLAVVLTGAITFMPPQWMDRMHTLGEYQADGSATGRLELWGISWKLALDRPLLGTGFTGPYTREVVDRVAPGGPARAVHSIWFELLSEQGFVTFAVWLAMTLTGAYWSQRLIRSTRGRPELAWAHDLGRMSQASLVAYVVSGTFLSLSYWDFYWTLLVVIGATWSIARRAEQPAPAAARHGSPVPAGWRAA
ncbi:putative O-glycosylation ligase, exosortase A system-associated [Roseococcus sp. SYP-B2431]|uniref:putative O-glycosylation ligase, exosortase A system-associated n=1 Tax=Roseococcus sp. SYP-B2431 TaxID=2496640 RepID=UPI00103AC8B4|nr:putative O-glycosylation ligase, exosortase A system-associated [Roseococcus sp. SYP-B2431]TCH96294.1 putative O-glycosylation ligase, exosortase A system-associated [Roseococcus sp. SYP-B2431]